MDRGPRRPSDSVSLLFKRHVWIACKFHIASRLGLFPGFPAQQDGQSSNIWYDQKNVKISHRNVIANVLQVSTFESTHKSVEPEMCLGVLPMSHNFALVIVSHFSLYRGDGVVVLPGFDLLDTLRAIQDYRLGRLWMVSENAMAWTKMY